MRVETYPLLLFFVTRYYVFRIRKNYTALYDRKQTIYILWRYIMVNFNWLKDWDGNEPIWTPEQYYDNEAIDACVAAKNNFMESYIATKVEPKTDGFVVDIDDVDWDNVDELVNNFREMAKADPERFIVTHEEQIYACSVYGVFYRYDHANNHDVFTLVWYD